MVRRTITELKAALAGVILQISFARFRASMVMVNVERALRRSVGGWKFACMVEGLKIWEKRRGYGKHRNTEVVVVVRMGGASQITCHNCSLSLTVTPSPSKLSSNFCHLLHPALSPYVKVSPKIP